MATLRFISLQILKRHFDSYPIVKKKIGEEVVTFSVGAKKLLFYEILEVD